MSRSVFNSRIHRLCGVVEELNLRDSRNAVARGVSVVFRKRKIMFR
jgi:hypothetical protein